MRDEGSAGAPGCDRAQVAEVAGGGKGRAQTGDLAGLHRPGAGQKQAQCDKAQAMAKTVGA